MAGLKLTEITKYYPSGATALYNVSLEAADKQFITVIGGEKSGKSTLIRIIAGLEEATSGVVEIDGKDMEDVDLRDRNVAMIFRGDSLNKALNVYENMAFGLRIRKAPQTLVDQRVKSAAQILGLTDCLYRKIKMLSASEKMRVVLGRALVREPRLYLFDEPLAGLDDKLRLDLLNVIINLQARMNGTFIYATKNISEALAAGTRVAVLKKGFLQQIDAPANLYDYPANTFVGFLVGSPNMQFVNGAKVEKSEGGYTARFGSLSFPIAENIEARFEKIEEYAQSGREIILGIRAEDAAISKDGEYSGKVESTVKDGEKLYASIKTAEKFSPVVTADEELKAGDEVKFNIDLTRLYVFDAETRLTLLARDGGYTQTGFADADRIPLTYPEEQAILQKLDAAKDGKGKKKR